MQAEKHTAPAAQPAEEEEDQKGWNLDDEAGFDNEEEDEAPVQPASKQPKAEEEAMDMEEGGDEIDPLDAFMADNESKVTPVKTEPASTAVKEEEDEVDPLDAFMMDNNVVAGVQQPAAVKPDPESKPSTSDQADNNHCTLSALMQPLLLAKLVQGSCLYCLSGQPVRPAMAVHAA